MFVQFVPEDLEDGVVYVSIEYRTLSHLCPCGCGEKVVTPLRPSQWALTYDGESVTLRPSIAGGRCNSHYWVTGGRVQWVEQLTPYAAEQALRRDRSALEREFEADRDHEALGQSRKLADPARWWRRVLGRFLGS